MDHVIGYMYSGHVTVTSNDLIPLYTLVERLRMKGDVQKQLMLNIGHQLKCNKSLFVQYLMQAKTLEVEDVLNEVYRLLSIKVDNRESRGVELSTLPMVIFKEAFMTASRCCKDGSAPYDLVLKYICHFTQSIDPNDRNYARYLIRCLYIWCELIWWKIGNVDLSHSLWLICYLVT